MNSAVILVLSALGLTAHGIKGNVELVVEIPLIRVALVGKLAGATTKYRVHLKLNRQHQIMGCVPTAL